MIESLQMYAEATRLVVSLTAGFAVCIAVDVVRSLRGL